MRDKTRRMILLATLAGLRVHEIAKIRGEDVDVAGRMIRVIGKNDKIALIPMHPILVEMAEDMPRKGFWFESPSRPGECLYSQSVSQIVGNAMRRAHIAGTPHSLRHWFASNLLASGADLLTIRELLRHSSVATTQIYTKVPDQHRSDAVSKLDPFRGRPR
ncbi:MAG: tyrosine-type recombinase/integrase [Nocardiaceae bacterium]|nr:tyrosine-type recombinase/integrase [Nocardiaceae bacterium]